MNTTTRNYETMYIVDSSLTDEQVDSIIAKYSGLITDQGGEVQAGGRWDKRRLAYEIMGRREGIYILMFFLGEPAVAKELDRMFRISDEVLRHIITRVEPNRVDISQIQIEKPQPAAETETAPQEPISEELVEEAAAEEQTEEPTEEKVEPETSPEAEEAAEEVLPEEETAIVETIPTEETPAEEISEETGDEEPKKDT